MRSMSKIVAAFLPILMLGCINAHLANSSENAADLQIDHIEAFEGGYAYSMFVYGSGRICMRKGWKRPKCAETTPCSAANLIKTAKSLSGGLDHVPHGELIQVRQEGGVKIFLADNDEVRSLALGVDTIFKNTFKEYYDWPIVPDQHDTCLSSSAILASPLKNAGGNGDILDHQRTR